MSDTSEAPQASAAELAVATEAQAPVESSQPFELTAASILDLTPEERRAALYENKPIRNQQPEKVAEPEPEAEPIIEPEAQVEPEPEPEPQIDEHDDPEFTKNFRLNAPNKQFSGFLKALKTAQQTNPNVNPAEVARLVGYDLPGIPVTAPAEIQTTTEPQADPIEIMQQEADALRERLKEFRDGLVTEEYQELQDKLSELRLDIRDAKRDAKQATEKQAETQQQRAEREQAERTSARQAVMANVLKEWPTADDESTPLGKEIALHYRAIEANPNHPHHAERFKDSYPAFLANLGVESKTAELKALGISDAKITEVLSGKRATAPSPAKAAAPATRPVPRTVLVTSAARNQSPSPTPAMTEQQILERAKLDPQFRRQALWGNGRPI